MLSFLVERLLTCRVLPQHRPARHRAPLRRGGRAGKAAVSMAILILKISARAAAGSFF